MARLMPGPTLLRMNDPRHREARRLLEEGNQYVWQGRWDVALGYYAGAVSQAPGDIDCREAYAAALMSVGRTQEAAAEFRRALKTAPQDQFRRFTRNNLIFLSDHDPDTDNARALAMRREWWRVIGMTIAAKRYREHDNDRDPDRPLRVGYITADARMHSAAFVFGPVVTAHDRKAVESVLYNNAPPDQRDQMTELFERACAMTVNVSGANDQQLAERIVTDRIDILVDLTGFSKGERLRTFCLTPAPIQVTAWGYALGTGLPIVRYFFADEYVIPAHERKHFAEEIVDLPCIVPYEAPPFAPDVNPLPSAADPARPFMFGSFSRPAKLNDVTYDLWAEVLRAVPRSTLLLKDFSYQSDLLCSIIATAFEKRGIDIQRIEFGGPTKQDEHLARYHDVDLALDPWPHGGGVTTLEGLWMGVPPISLATDRIVSRTSGSILRCMQLDESFVAATPEQYVKLAVWWASEEARPQLAALRASMRERMEAAPFYGESRAYVRAVEAKYRWMWHRHLGELEATGR